MGKLPRRFYLVLISCALAGSSGCPDHGGEPDDQIRGDASIADIGSLDDLIRGDVAPPDTAVIDDHVRSDGSVPDAGAGSDHSLPDLSVHDGNADSAVSDHGSGDTWLDGSVDSSPEDRESSDAGTIDSFSDDRGSSDTGAVSTLCEAQISIDPWTWDVLPVPETPLPWVHFDGEHFRLGDGREFVVRGLDYAYDTVGYTDVVVTLEESDFARMAQWGATVLRIRMRDVRSGWYPWQAPEQAYIEGLDRIIEGANRQGIYVILANDGAEQMLSLEYRAYDPLYEQARLSKDGRARTHWLAYIASFFKRYRDQPGVLGFDPLNENYAYPPETHDSLHMEDAHLTLLRLLREHDTRHVYFQEPAGWDYHPEYHVSMGHQLPDTNTVFCTKWWTMEDAQARMTEMVSWAAQAGTPLFVCEAWVWDILRTRNGQTIPPAVIRSFQREALDLMDQNAVGWITNGYLPLVGLLTQEKEPIHLVDEWVRPYPTIVGGAVSSLSYDFDIRTLTVDLTLDQSGETELFVPYTHTYPQGFEVLVGAEGRLAIDATGIVVESNVEQARWELARRRVVLPPYHGALRVQVVPMEDNPGPMPQTTTRLDYGPEHFPTSDDVLHPVFGATEGELTMRDRMLCSGEFTPAEVDCILQQWQTTMSSVQWEITMRAALMQVDQLELFAAGVEACVPD